jgi:hypothetical protein
LIVLTVLPPLTPQLGQFWPLLSAQLPPVSEDQHIVLYDLRHFRLSVGSADAAGALQTFAGSARRVAVDPLVVLPGAVREILLGTRAVFALNRATRVTTALRLEGSRVVELSAEFASLGVRALGLSTLLKHLRAQGRGFARAAGIALAPTAGVWLLTPSAVAPGLAGLLEIARFVLPVVAASLVGATIESLLAHARNRAELERLERRIEALGLER